MKNTNTEISFTEACEIYIKYGIYSGYQNGIFSLQMLVKGEVFVYYDDLFIAPLRVIKLISKTTQSINSLEMLVITPEFGICTVCQVTPRVLQEPWWLSENISCASGLLMNANRYKPYRDRALKMSEIMHEVKVATQSGWLNSAYVFGDEIICTPGAPNENWLARTEYTLSEARVDRAIPDAQIAEEMVSTAFHLFRPGAVASIISIGHHAYLYENLRDRESDSMPRMTPLILAPSNSGKTTVLEKIICPALKNSFSISAQSTPAALSTLLQERFSRPLLVDDFNPQMDAQVRKELEEIVLRSVGDRNSQRITARNVRQRASPVSTIAFFTAENYKVTGTSSIARTLPLEIQVERSTWEMVDALPETVVATCYYKLLATFIHNDRFDALEASFKNYRRVLHEKFDKMKYLPRVIDNLASVMAGWSLIRDWFINVAPALYDRVSEITDDLDEYLFEMAAKQQDRIREEASDTLFLLELFNRLRFGETRKVKVTADGRSFLSAEGATAEDIIETTDSLYLCIDLEQVIRLKLGGKKECGRSELRNALKKSEILIPPINTKYLSVQMNFNDKPTSFIRLNKQKVEEFFVSLNY